MVPESTTSRRALRRNPEALALGSLVLLLLAAYAWSLWIAKVGYSPLSSLVPSDSAFVPSNQIRVYVLPVFLTDIVGIGLGAWVYARVRDLDVPWRLPSRNRVRIAVATVLAAPVLVALAVLAGRLVFGAPATALTGLRYAPEARLAYLVFSSFVPSVLTGIGYGFAVFGVVHRRVREATTPRHAVVLTPLIAGVFWEARGGVRHLFAWSPSPPEVARILLVLVAAVALGASLGLLYRGAFRAPAERLLRARYIPVLAFGLFGAGVVVASIADLPSGLIDVLRLVAFGVAAYGYERTGSIWVPVLVLAILPASLDLATWQDSVGLLS